MNDLTLQQMEKLGISKWMNEKERERAIEKALEEQKELIANDSHKEVFEALRTTDEILVQGGLFTWKLGYRTVRCSVLTPQEKQNLMMRLRGLLTAYLAWGYTRHQQVIFNYCVKLISIRRNEMSIFKTNKFNKGDKVIRVGDTSAIGVNFGRVYTVDNPSSHDGFYDGELHNHVTLVEVESTPSDKHLELYVEQRNYREMTPNNLIAISIEVMELS